MILQKIITSVDNVIHNIAWKYIKIIDDNNVNTKTIENTLVNIENTNDITENTYANSGIEIIKKQARAIRERSKLLWEEIRN